MALDGVVGAVKAVWLRWERVKFYFLIRRQAERKEWGEVAGNRLLGLTLNCYTVCGTGEEKPSGQQLPFWLQSQARNMHVGPLSFYCYRP